MFLSGDLPAVIAGIVAHVFLFGFFFFFFCLCKTVELNANTSEHRCVLENKANRVLMHGVTCLQSLSGDLPAIIEQ